MKTAPQNIKIPTMPPTRMPVMEPVPNLRFGFVYLGFWNLGSIGVVAKGLIKADVGVGRREEEVTLWQFSPTVSRF